MKKVTEVVTAPLGEVGDWLKNPYVSVTVNGNKLTVGPQTLTIQSDGRVRLNISGQNDSAFVKLGGVTVQTGKLRQRLTQAGCIAETGDVMGCAPDVVAKVAAQLAQEAAAGTTSTESASQGYDTLEPVDDHFLTEADVVRIEQGAFGPPKARWFGPMAQVCVTQFGTAVPLVHPKPFGEPCTAVFPWGMFPGVAR